MSIIIKRLLNIILFSSLCCFSQKPSDVYIIYKTNKGGMCNESSNREGDNLRKVNFDYKYSNGFEICYEVFMIKPKTCVDELSQEDLKNLNIIDINFFKRKHEDLFKNKNIINANTLFPKIFILQEIENEKYLKFQVYWKEYDYSRVGGGG
jgi:hypothetical protein